MKTVKGTGGRGIDSMGHVKFVVFCSGVTLNIVCAPSENTPLIKISVFAIVTTQKKDLKLYIQHLNIDVFKM